MKVELGKRKFVKELDVNRFSYEMIWSRLKVIQSRVEGQWQINESVSVRLFNDMEMLGLAFYNLAVSVVLFHKPLCQTAIFTNFPVFDKLNLISKTRNEELNSYWICGKIVFKINEKI